jgi:hypothetical protein
MSKTAATVLLASLGAADAAACVPSDSCPMLADGLYCPVNDVTEHADINRDVAAISSLLSADAPTQGDYAAAKAVYTDGQNSVKAPGMRTLQALAQKDMTSSGKYTNAYYSGNVNVYDSYSNVWDSPIVACLDAADWCADKSDPFKKYIINKGLIGIVGGYATYEMGAAIWKAGAGQLDDGQAAYAWDEAAAFYIGNIADVDITDPAPSVLYSPYEFMWKRDDDFPDGTSTHTEAVPILNSGLGGLRGTYNEQAVSDAQLSLYKIMSIAAIRSAIKYSWKAVSHEKYVAEGAMYWRFASGYIASVSTSLEALVKEVDTIWDVENPASSRMLTEEQACEVKTKVEAMYAGLGITCAMVGEWKTDTTCDACDDDSATGSLSAGSSDYEDMCMASTTADDTGDASDAFAAQIPGTIAMAALAGVAFATAGRP